MRILFLALDVNIKSNAGDAVHVRELAKSFVDLGHKVSLIAPYTDEPDDELKALKEYDNLRIFFNKPHPRFHNISTVRFCRRIAKGHRSEIIYERRFSPKIGYLVSKLLKIPLVVEINGIKEKERELQKIKEERGMIPKGIKMRIWRHFFRSVSKVVVVSEGLKRGLSEEYGIPHHKITVIYNGANTDLFKPLDRDRCLEELGLEKNFRYIGFLGNLAPWQGVEQLIKIGPRILEAEPDTRLLIVGGGLLNKELKQQARDLGIDDKVIFTGFVPYKTVPKYINSFDICTAPFNAIERNLKYSFSAIKLYEYMACGKPVVTTDVIGIKDEMQNLGLGRVVKADNLDELAISILDLLQDEKLRNEMGERARSWVASEHSWKNVAQRVVKVCENVIASSINI
jgi:glycosyltransferase involved in cell wall biosynthesis